MHRELSVACLDEKRRFALSPIDVSAPILSSLNPYYMFIVVESRSTIVSAISVDSG